MSKLIYNAIYLLIAHVNHKILHERFSLMIIICSKLKASIIVVLRDDRLTVTLAKSNFYPS